MSDHIGDVTNMVPPRFADVVEHMERLEGMGHRYLGWNGHPGGMTLHFAGAHEGEPEPPTLAELSARLLQQAEAIGAIRGAVRNLFEHGGPQLAPLPVACRKLGQWQAPGTVAVQVEALRYLWRQAGVEDA